jgi:mannosyltransferase OCH1-like enzyme
MIDPNLYFSDKMVDVPHVDMAHTEGGTIPRTLHLIWFGDIAKFAPYEGFFNKWTELMPHWTIRLWRDDDMREFPEAVQQKIAEATQYAQKADIARYFILEKYGGVYLDTDVVPYRSLDPIIALDYDIVTFNEWQDVVWEYMAQFFIACIPHHPAMQLACQYALGAQLNTGDINDKTGPRMWGWAIANAIKTEKMYAILDYKYFTTPEGFGKHLYAHSWK